MSRMVGTVSRGIRAPIIRNGDDIVEIVTDSILEASKDAGFEIQDRDIVAMTEAIVARAQGNYASVEDIAKAFGIDVVPIIFEGTIQEGVDFVKSNPKSTIGTAMMEGLVGRPKIEMRDRCGKRVIVKIKVKDFK